MVRDEAKVVGRWHDNRHTLVTELAESGAGDEVIMSIAGHVSRAMLADRVRVLWPPGPKCRPIRDANERCRASITGALERGAG